MTALRTVFATLVGWTALLLLLLAGLVALATSVEAAARGADALLLGALAVPGLLVLLAPVAVGAGVALAAARMDSRKERLALEVSGIGPVQTLASAAVLGLLLGLGALLAADHLVPKVEQRAAQVRGRDDPRWIWVGEGALRARDDVLVHVADGRITRVEPRAAVDPQLVVRQRALQDPRTAAGAVLQGAALVPAQVERLARRARVFACVVLGVWAWLPDRRGSTPALGRQLLWLLLYFALDQSLLAQGAQGSLPPGVAAFAAPLLAAVGVLLRLSPRRAPTTPST